MSTCLFVQIRCRPGTTYRVADAIALKEIHSELYSTSGDFDLPLAPIREWRQLTLDFASVPGGSRRRPRYGISL